MDSRKKILFVIPTLNGGGSERVFVNIIRQMDFDKFNVYLLLTNKTGIFVKDIPNKVTIHSLKKTRTRYIFFTLLKNINRIKPDILFSTTNRMNLMLCFVSYFLTFKSLLIIREPNMPSAQFNNKQLPGYYRWLGMILYRKASTIISQTDDMKQEIADYYKLNLDNIIVILNPIDKKYIDKKVKEAVNPFENKYINIVASGRLRQEKGYEFLLKVFNNVLLNEYNYFLHILGDTDTNKEYYQSIVNLSKKLNINNRVSFYGFVENPFPYYKYADLIVLSSKWEGLPNVVLESLYLKTPVVVTNCISHFKELIRVGIDGYIVEYGDEEYFAESILNFSKLRVSHSTDIGKNYYNKFFHSIS